MAIFGKQLRSIGRGDPESRLAALEEHIRYMQELLEYYARQTEKGSQALESDVASLKKRVTSLENK